MSPLALVNCRAQPPRPMVPETLFVPIVPDAVMGTSAWMRPKVVRAATA